MIQEASGLGVATDVGEDALHEGGEGSAFAGAEEGEGVQGDFGGPVRGVGV